MPIGLVVRMIVGLPRAFVCILALGRPLKPNLALATTAAEISSPTFTSLKFQYYVVTISLLLTLPLIQYSMPTQNISNWIINLFVIKFPGVDLK